MMMFNWGRVGAWIAGSASLLLIGCSADGSNVPEPVESIRQQVVTDQDFGEGTALVNTETTTLVASTALSNARFVSAFKLGTTTTGSLQVTLARLNNDATMTRLHSRVTAHVIRDKVSVARVDDRRFVVAARNADGELLVAAFAINAADEIVSTDSTVRFAVSDVAATSLNSSPGVIAPGGPPGRAGEGQVVISYRGVNGGLGLLGYTVTAEGGLRATGSVTAGATPYVNVAYVPGSQPPSAWFSRGPVASEQSAGACSNGSDDDGDGYVDCNDWDCCGNAACDGVDACVQGTVVTATYNNSNSTKLISWKVSAQGNITRAREILTGPGSVVDVSAQSFGRVATARTNGNENVVTTWDVSSSGAFSEHASVAIPVTGASNARVVSGGGARLFVLSADSAGTGYLSTLDAIDNLHEVGRLTLPAQHWSNAGALLSLGSDRAVLTFPTQSNQLQRRSYRDFAQPLVRGSFAFRAPDTSTPVNNTSSPLAILSPTASAPPITPNGDVSIAVGGDFVMACGNGTTVIYDKAGNNLTGEQTSPNPIFPCKNNRCLTHGQLFASVLSPTVAGTVNHQSLNRHLSHQYVCDGSKDSSTATGSQNGCLAAIYDTDCGYDAASKRFVVVSAVRHQKGDPLQRHLAIAVSKDADPRHGFNVYATTDNKYDDDPEAVAGGGVLVLTHHNARPDPWDEYGETLTPSAMVFDVANLSAGVTDISSSKVSPWQTGGQIGVSVAQVRGLATGLGAIYRRVAGQGVELFTFVKNGRGPLSVMSDPDSYLPSGRGDAKGWLDVSFGAPPTELLGKFYLADDYTDEDGVGRVRVSGADVNILRDGAGVFGMVLTPMANVGETFGCGANLDCRQPSVAVVGGNVYSMYYSFDNRYQACPAGVSCASGVCIGSVCQSSPRKPGVYYTKFNGSLVRQGSAASLLVAGGRVAVTDAATEVISCSAAVDDVANNSIWGMDAVPGTSGWSSTVAQFR